MKTELTPLQKTIFNLAMNGGSVMYENEIWQVDGLIPSMSETFMIAKKMTISFACHVCEKGLAKPLLHSLNKLTESNEDYFFELNLQLCEILNTSSCDYFLEALLKGKYYALDFNKSVEVNDFFKTNHFNTENLPEGTFIEIETLKEK